MVFLPLGLFTVIAFFGWLVFAWLYFRWCRQGELLDVLVVAARQEAPLVPALRAYAHEPPDTMLRYLLIRLGSFLIVPVLFYFFYRQRGYRQKVGRLAGWLEAGTPLSVALRHTWGVASAAMVQAAAVGEACGNLPTALERVAVFRRRFLGVWLPMIPRLAYPLLLLLVGSAAVGFMGMYVAPRYERILSDFRVPPDRFAAAVGEATESISSFVPQGSFFFSDLAYKWTWHPVSRVVIQVGVLLAESLMALALIIIVLVSSSSVRWYTPVIAYYYRAASRGQVLQMLGLLVEVGRPLPEALGTLARAGFAAPVRRRLYRAQALAEQGRSLSDSLHQASLLPRNMKPLVDSAQAMGNLPWALRELAEGLFARLQRRLYRVMMTVFPASVMLVGAVFGAICVAMFLPLITLIERLGGLNW